MLPISLRRRRRNHRRSSKAPGFPAASLCIRRLRGRRRAWHNSPALDGTCLHGRHGPAGSGVRFIRQRLRHHQNSVNPDQAWTFLSEYLSTDGMIFMWGSTGRGSPARKDAYPSWIESEDAPENAVAYLEALDTYAVTGRPYQTLAAAELIDISSARLTCSNPVRSTSIPPSPAS